MKNSICTSVVAVILCVIFSFSAVNTVNTLFTAQRDVYCQQWSWERYMKNYWHIKLLNLAEQIERNAVVVPDSDMEDTNDDVAPNEILPEQPPPNVVSEEPCGVLKQSWEC